MRWTGEADFEDDPRLEKLQEIYLKNRQQRLRNVAFDANATEGGENKSTSLLILSFQSGFCRTTSKLCWLVSGAPRTTRSSTTLPSPWRAPLASSEAPWASSRDFLSSVVLRLSIILQSTLASLSLMKGIYSLVKNTFKFTFIRQQSSCRKHSLYVHCSDNLHIL